MKMRSLTRQAIVIVVLAELLCAIVFSGLALWHEGRTRLRAFDVMLQGRSDSLLGAVQDAEDPDDNVTIDPTELRLPAEDAYAVYNQGGRLLGASAAAPLALIARSGDGVRTVRSSGQQYRVLQRNALRIIDREENGGPGIRRPVTILYAAPTAHLRQEIVEAASFYVLLSILSVCATTILLILLTGRLLRPIRDLAVAARAVTASSLTFEPPIAALHVRELRPLAGALSETVVRLRQAFDAEHRFIGDAAHELKTAVAVVRSTVQVLSLRPRSREEYQRGLELVLRDNERVETLVARMLTLARFKERSHATPGVIHVSQAIQAAVHILASFAESRGVLLEATLAPEFKARFNVEAIEVLVSNLVMNAVQHSPPDATVFVVLKRVEGQLNTAMLEVIDSGAGITAESLPYVFDRFFRDDQSRSRDTGGAGLGLAICKSIVEAAGGTIAVDSEPGRGATARCTFSLA